MDPVTMAMVGTAVSAAGQIYNATATASTMEAQAAAETQKAQIESQWSERKGLEERAAAQRTAGEEQRKARLTQSRLGAVAGASGSGADDPTVMKLWEGIQREGDVNAGYATASGEQKAAGMEYDAALNRWRADSDARLKRFGAQNTLIGGYIGAAGTAMSGWGQSRMAAKYGQGDLGLVGGKTGYGR